MDYKYKQMDKETRGVINLGGNMHISPEGPLSPSSDVLKIKDGNWFVNGYFLKTERYNRKSSSFSTKKTLSLVVIVHTEHENLPIDYIVDKYERGYSSERDLILNVTREDSTDYSNLSTEEKKKILDKKIELNKKDEACSYDYINVSGGKASFRSPHISPIYTHSVGGEVVAVLFKVSPVYADAMIPIGQFEIKSGRVMVSDPCYDLDTWCQGSLSNVYVGEWNAFVKKTDEGLWGYRCSELIALKDGLNVDTIVIEEKTDIHVGVDSGQAGIFDVDIYKDDASVLVETNFMPDDPWYSLCCDLTLKDPGAGVINGGVVSRSGLGDGGYNCYIVKDELNVIIGIKIVFIGDYEEE